MSKYYMVRVKDSVIVHYERLYGTKFSNSVNSAHIVRTGIFGFDKDGARQSYIDLEYDGYKSYGYTTLYNLLITTLRDESIDSIL